MEQSRALVEIELARNKPPGPVLQAAPCREALLDLPCFHAYLSNDWQSILHQLPRALAPQRQTNGTDQSQPFGCKSIQSAGIHCAHPFPGWIVCLAICPDLGCGILRQDLAGTRCCATYGVVPHSQIDQLTEESQSRPRTRAHGRGNWP